MRSRCLICVVELLFAYVMLAGTLPFTFILHFVLEELEESGFNLNELFYQVRWFLPLCALQFTQFRPRLSDLFTCLLGRKSGSL